MKYKICFLVLALAALLSACSDGEYKFPLEDADLSTSAARITLTSLSPESGNNGTTVVITGSGLNASKDYVWIGGALIEAMNVPGDATKIAFDVPYGMPAGLVEVRVVEGNYTSNALNFTIIKNSAAQDDDVSDTDVSDDVSADDESIVDEDDAAKEDAIANVSTSLSSNILTVKWSVKNVKSAFILLDEGQINPFSKTKFIGDKYKPYLGKKLGSFSSVEDSADDFLQDPLKWFDVLGDEFKEKIDRDTSSSPFNYCRFAGSEKDGQYVKCFSTEVKNLPTYKDNWDNEFLVNYMNIFLPLDDETEKSGAWEFVVKKKPSSFILFYKDWINEEVKNISVKIDAKGKINSTP